MKFHRWPTMVILSPSVVLLEASGIIWPRIEPTSRFDDAHTHNFIPPSRCWFLKSCSPLPISREIIQFDQYSSILSLSTNRFTAMFGLVSPDSCWQEASRNDRSCWCSLRDTNGTTKTYPIAIVFLLFCLWNLKACHDLQELLSFLLFIYCMIHI